FLTATAEQRMAQAKQQAEQLQQFRRDLFVSIFGAVKH
ncbi:MAG: gas vesicle protein GvpC, partial [Scytonema sp. PMC 1069.18]|nr:gas vesicle protein GvpC [Scytonema sp. PMC 1069.18]